MLLTRTTVATGVALLAAMINSGQNGSAVISKEVGQARLSPSDTVEKPTLSGLYVCFHDSRSRVVGQLEAELTEDPHCPAEQGARILRRSPDQRRMAHYGKFRRLHRDRSGSGLSRLA